MAHIGRLEALAEELFSDWPAETPQEIVLDVDGTDNPLHALGDGRRALLARLLRVLLPAAMS